MTTSNAFISPYKIFNNLSKLSFDPNSLILHDSKIKFPKKLICVSVKGGEALKDLKSFEKIIGEISKLEETHPPFQGIYVVGGGSVGDLGAFIASVYRRGLRLVQVPTTYLSVIDSAFGGKSAINFNGAKNQIGTFYPADKVVIVKDLLPKDKKLLRDAFAEILKMAILKGSLWEQVERVKEASNAQFWKLAPATIEAKLEIVEKDPWEKSGYRSLLNLGHTFGHVFEKLASLTHGEAVALGLSIELDYFFSEGNLPEDAYLKIMEVWERFFNFSTLSRKLGRHSLTSFQKIIRKDKKNQNSYLRMPVVYGIGKVEIEKVALEKLLNFIAKQDFIKK